MIILSVDLGDVRTGVAVCDRNEILASPVCVINERSREVLVDKIIEIAHKKGAEKIVLGLPKNMDGSEGSSAVKTRNFGKVLQDKSGIKVVWLDERGTTISAYNYLNETDTRGKKRKSVVDSVAAVIILQNYIDAKKTRESD